MNNANTMKRLNTIIDLDFLNIKYNSNNNNPIAKYDINDSKNNTETIPMCINLPALNCNIFFNLIINTCFNSRYFHNIFYR